jgi:hypothetical protein
VWQLFTSYKSVTRQFSHCANKKEVQHSGKPNIISPLLQNVKGDDQSQSQSHSMTTFTSWKTMSRQVSHCANKKEVQHSGKQNIIPPLLHNVKGDGQSQSQSVTTFTSWKTTSRQVSHCANKKEVQHNGKPNIINFT